jgi:hypothetical protein
LEPIEEIRIVSQEKKRMYGEDVYEVVFTSRTPLSKWEMRITPCAKVRQSEEDSVLVDRGHDLAAGDTARSIVRLIDRRSYNVVICGETYAGKQIRKIAGTVVRMEEETFIFTCTGLLIAKRRNEK